MAACATGKTQSPIDIRHARKADLPALKFDYNSVPLNLTDTLQKLVDKSFKSRNRSRQVPGTSDASKSQLGLTRS